MKWWEKLRRKVASLKGEKSALKEEKKGWEELVEIIEEAPYYCFPENFRHEEDIAKTSFYNEFRKIREELYKKSKSEYWQECSRYVEWEMQKHKYNLKEIKKKK